MQVISIHAGGHQTFIRTSSIVRPSLHRSSRWTRSSRLLLQAQAPDDYRTFHLKRPILELTLDFAKWLHQAPDSSDQFKVAKQ